VTLSAAAISARLLTAGLPTLPTTVAKLESLILSGDAPSQVIIDVIATDPAITALVIGQANASGHHTISLAEALRHNGLGVVLATARCAIQVEARSRPVITACWAQANLVAVLVPLIAEHRRYHLKRNWDAETLQVCGLTHDLGHVLALTHFPEAYGAAAVRCDAGGGTFTAMLESELGIELGKLSAQACVGWSLPPLLAVVMAHWRNPAQAPNDGELCAIVNVAHTLAMAIGFTAGADRFVAPFDDWSMSKLELRIADLETLVSKAFDVVEELAL
jgi:HD-like signal output (HDOD) protein